MLLLAGVLFSPWDPTLFFQSFQLHFYQGEITSRVAFFSPKWEKKPCLDEKNFRTVPMSEKEGGLLLSSFLEALLHLATKPKW